MWRKYAGATLLEFAVVASVLGILAFVLLDRMSYYQERAEKANMESIAAALKGALVVELSILMAQDRMRESPVLLQRNPMDWLDQKPANYLGEFDGAAPDTLPRGSWYYDRKARELVYRVNQGRYFQPDSRGRQEARFRISVIYDEMVENGGVGSSPMAPSGVKLTLVEMYKWF